MKANIQFEKDFYSQNDRLKQIDDLLHNMYAESARKLKNSVTIQSYGSQDTDSKDSQRQQNLIVHHTDIVCKFHDYSKMNTQLDIFDENKTIKHSKHKHGIKKYKFQYQKPQIAELNKIDQQKYTLNAMHPVLKLDQSQKVIRTGLNIQATKKQQKQCKLKKGKKNKSEQKRYKDLLNIEMEIVKQLIDTKRHLKHQINYRLYSQYLKKQMIKS